MTEQDGTQPSTTQRRSRKSSATNRANGNQAPALKRPANDDIEGWKAFWKERGQSWRKVPEIDEERQKFLAERRNIAPDIKKGIYSFKDIKLCRADVEWLLATHDEGRGPINWDDAAERAREGLDLRGAVVEEATDLSALPLARLQGGIWFEGWQAILTEQQRTCAQLCLKHANLSYAHLEGANLTGADLEGVNLSDAHLEGTDIGGAHLKGADLSWAHLEGADLSDADLQESDLRGASLASVDLARTTLANATGVGPSVVDTKWGETHLSVVNWSQVQTLGDEQVARQEKDREGKIKDPQTRVDEQKDAVRANRQLAVVLRDQGLNEAADHFAYRAQLLQRMVFWREHEFGRWLFSLLLAVLSGYGYRIWRILAAYAVVVSVFALVYFVFGRYYPPHLPLHQALLESITAFHGRVFLEQFNPDTPQIWFTALEAIAGLLIEGVFIAMLIQRFFGK